MNWREMTRNYVLKAEMTALMGILNTMNLRNLFQGKREKYREPIDKGDKQALFGLLEVLAEDKTYSTFLFPAIPGRESAPNFYIPGENDTPEEGEKWKAIYIIFSSVRVGNTLLNLDNIGEKGRNQWRQKLHSENPAQFYKEIRGEFELFSRNFGPFFTSLLAFGYFIAKVRNELAKKKGIRGSYGLSDFIDDLYEEYGFRRDTTLVVVSGGPREKKEVHYLSSLVPLTSRWFSGFVENREERPALLTFIDSLSNVKGTKRYELASSLREKLSYYLLRYGRINSETLDSLVELRVEDTLASASRSKKGGSGSNVYGIMSARDFFSYL
jgi:hypothetical protein